MIAADIPALKSCGKPLKMGSATFGELSDSSSFRDDPAALNQRMSEDGYLLMRGFLNPELIRAARQTLISKLEKAGLLEEDSDPDEGILKKDSNLSRPEFTEKEETISRVVFGPEMKSLYTDLLGGTIRHFDFIWHRIMGPGSGTRPHCDRVYMGRGTHRLYTAWIPYGHVSYELGGLMILEKSHLKADRIRKYLDSDVNSYCVNRPAAKGKNLGGALSTNPVSLQEKMGGRWLTTEFEMGDLLTFRTDLIHASTDNSTNRVRLSTDTRYQRSDEPIDERWIGENPIGHGPAGQRGRIC